MPDDAVFMRRAIELAGCGFPAPNPRVGCVIARESGIVGEGWHDHAGGPHAEVMALAEAGERARGATAYVTLEPCDHYGRTGPCSLALIAAGIARVHYAVADPNPTAQGGAARLRAAGVDVIRGPGEEEAANRNRSWLTSQRLGRPFVTLKAAMSLDGRIALPDGNSRWITGEAARSDGHRLRAEMGTILVGRGTVEADDPQLTARLEGVVNQPLRVVLDPTGKLGAGHRVFDAEAPTLRYTRVPSRAGDCPWPGDLAEVMRDLFARGSTGLLVEGGARTHASFLAAHFADRLVLYVAPKVLGAGLSWVEGVLTDPLAKSELHLTESFPIGDDLRLTYERV